MAFNCQMEKRKFEREWEQLRQEYEVAGMPPEMIDELYAFDWEWFCSRRSFGNRNQSLPTETIVSEDGEEQSSLVQKFKSFSVTLDESLMGGRFGWIEQIEDVNLVDKLRQLSEDDLELLTLIAFDGYKQPQIAKLLDCSQSNISQKITRLKKYFKKSKTVL